ncbi:uroporphyrinogen decarboxylase family protein [Anaerobaca lacustris]|uniref:Uroporphyrinogen decarboxylase family protein n=1 Tax=Anaerobaca lacustris TaxID=3044600 RepID=A0AAW6U059_9BACT|nr:uroporphyrinogen decarboxylase family protein [Sedimentisphaerales bacterium M17dextr]
MTSRERLMATLEGRAVDRPAVSFYEVGGLTMDPSDPDPFNIYRDPSWQPLLALAEERTDLIRMRSPVRAQSHQAWDSPQAASEGPRSEFFAIERYLDRGCRITRTTLTIAGRVMTGLTRRDPDVDTVWTAEHLLKSPEDVGAYLQLPDEVFAETIDVSPLIEEEKRLGERGIVMVDTEDPLCAAATLFSMEDFTILAMTQQDLFHRLLEKHARFIQYRTEQVARQFPGRLWRIYGPEFATQPYLPPHLFDEYVVRYTGPMIEAIHRSGGFARVHIHGRIRNVLNSVVRMGADAIDPIEPPPQGDVDLAFVRTKYGKSLVLFGNIEIADVESAEPDRFEKIVRKALADGTRGPGRGFVLMPSACPYGRTVSARTLRNYETMIRCVEDF